MPSIEKLLERYAQAIYQQALSSLQMLYTEDVVVFNAAASLEFQGLSAWSEALSQWFDALGSDRIRLTFLTPETEVEADMARIHSQLLIERITPHESFSDQIPASFLLRKQAGDWKIIQESNALPIPDFRPKDT